MKKHIQILIISLFLFSCHTPEKAADDICQCFHQTVRYWVNDEKTDAILKFSECGKMQEDYKKLFSGHDLQVFEEKYDQCLQETIKSEILIYLLK